MNEVGMVGSIEFEFSSAPNTSLRILCGLFITTSPVSRVY